jgi:hypothetical protein
MTVPDDAADNVIEREHPASDVEFAAVAVLATLAFETDTKGSALPPLWPMLLHFFSDFAVPTGTAAESLDASAIPQLIRALHSPIHRHQHEGAFGMRKVLSRERVTPVRMMRSRLEPCRCWLSCWRTTIPQSHSSKQRGR